MINQYVSTNSNAEKQQLSGGMIIVVPITDDPIIRRPRDTAPAPPPGGSGRSPAAPKGLRGHHDDPEVGAE